MNLAFTEPTRDPLIPRSTARKPLVARGSEALPALHLSTSPAHANRSAPLTMAGVTHLQRAAGNRAVAQLLEAHRRQPAAAGTGGGVVVQRDPSTEDCDEDQEQTVLTSHFAAQRFLRAAIAATEPTLADLAPGVADAIQ